MKLLVLFLIAAQLSFGAGLIGLDALGTQGDGASASVKGMGNSGNALVENEYSLLNPAAMAFNQKTVFSATFGMSDGNFTYDGKKGKQSQFSLPIIAFDFPMGVWGNLGFSYFQAFNKQFEYEQGKDYYLRDGGQAEFVPSYSYAFTKNIALGFNYHFVGGREKIEKSYSLTDVQNDGSHVDSQLDSTVIDENTSIKNSSDGYWGASIAFENERFALYVYNQVDYDVDKDYSLSRQIDDDNINTQSSRVVGIDSVYIPGASLTQTIPALYGAGLAYKLTLRHVFTLDYTFQDWGSEKYYIKSFNSSLDNVNLIETQTASHIGFGYEYGGNSKQYGAYYRRMSYRAGAFIDQLYLKDLSQWGFALGTGMPLGRRGHTLDLTFEAKYLEDTSQKLNESQYSIWVTFIGLGNWGESSRRYR